MGPAADREWTAIREAERRRRGMKGEWRRKERRGRRAEREEISKGSTDEMARVTGQRRPVVEWRRRRDGLALISAKRVLSYLPQLRSTRGPSCFFPSARGPSCFFPSTGRPPLIAPLPRMRGFVSHTVPLMPRAIHYVRPRHTLSSISVNHRFPIRASIHPFRQTDGQTDRQTNRQTDKQTDRPTGSGRPR